MNQSITIQCPLCNDLVDKLVYRYHLDNERQVLAIIRQQNPDWTIEDGLCSRCLDYYHTQLIMRQRMLPEIGPHFPVKSADDFIILPVGLRLNADPRFTGKGVTICFIDSDFYPHPDLTAHKNRIKAIIDIPNKKNIFRQKFDGLHEGQNNISWHGTMTTVVCAGDGFLSKGLYKGIASDAELVLLKVQDDSGHISDDSIIRALEWILHHHHLYDIRVVNVSLGAEAQEKVNVVAEKLVEKGIVVVAAAGNDDKSSIKAPASSPGVIAVGGVDDHNSLVDESISLYHSSYGMPAGNLMKPELLAHAIWIAAPIMPYSTQWYEAAQLYSQPAGETRHIVQEKKYISPHYLHSDGTSFAAPIVCSIIAQLLEINPSLTPSMIRTLLLGTSKRIANFAAERQGFGVVQPRKAVLKVLNRQEIRQPEISPLIDSQQKTISFYIQHDHASQISLAGSFNHWANDQLLLEPGSGGIWKIEIPLLPAGTYQYKFLVDEQVWVEDIINPYRQPDGFSGFNSILIIDN